MCLGWELHAGDIIVARIPGATIIVKIRFITDQAIQGTNDHCLAWESVARTDNGQPVISGRLRFSPQDQLDRIKSARAAAA